MTKCYRCEATLQGSRCRKCGAWNIFNFAPDAEFLEDGTVTLDQVKSAEITRLDTGKYNLIWSGKEEKGVVRTSVSMVGGKRGAGKTTMLLELAGVFARSTGLESGYLAAEQSPEELKLFAERLLIQPLEKIRVIPALSGTVDTAAIFAKYKFGALIVDSVQDFFGEDSEAIVGFCKTCKQYAVQNQTPVILISHVNKEGDYAGLERIQHSVDTLLMFDVYEDDKEVEGLRELRVEKNRFGRAHIKLFLEMTETGLERVVDLENEDEDVEDED